MDFTRTRHLRGHYEAIVIVMPGERPLLASGLAWA